MSKRHTSFYSHQSILNNSTIIKYAEHNAECYFELHESVNNLRDVEDNGQLNKH